MWPLILPALGKLAGIFSGAAGGAASGRAKEAEIALGQDRLRQQQAEAERQYAIQSGQLGLQQRTTGQDLESQAQRQALLGLLMQGNPSHVQAPMGSGIQQGTYTPMSIPGRADLGAQLNTMAQQRLTSGSDKQFPGLPNVPTPMLTPNQKPSILDKILQIGGLVGGVAGALPTPTPKTPQSIYSA